MQSFHNIAVPALQDGYAEQSPFIFDSPMELDFAELTQGWDTRNDVVINLSPLSARAMCQTSTTQVSRWGGAGSVYAESLPPQTPTYKMEPTRLAPSLAEVSTPPSVTARMQAFELYNESQSPAFANQSPDNLGTSHQSQGIDITTKVLFSLEDESSSLHPDERTPRLRCWERGYNGPKFSSQGDLVETMPAAREETSPILHKGQLILWESAHRTIVKHFPTHPQHETLSTLHTPLQVDDGAAQTLFAVFLMCYILFASPSYPMELDKDDDKVINNVLDPDYPIMQENRGCQSNDKDAPYEIDDFQYRQPIDSETDAVHSLKRKRLCLQSGSSPKRVKDEVRQDTAPRQRRKDSANTRFECAIYRESPNRLQQIFKWERRRDDEWAEKSKELLSLLKLDIGGMSIQVRPNAGQELRMEWSEEERKFIGLDVPGRRKYLQEAIVNLNILS
ncbi:hypothetical protein E0Z10_g5320 [Xylaria hypoxylon]|uniref:Uncharacterized protein n=1 Tax=Xylaria hypoxylon TaxID=37992 RepID=A0A4Z0YHI5_9PEZI|nr:hypothetical protein E0Z10_g5320 [Xylaria hypoxylon]